MELVSQLIVEPVVKALTGYITQKLRNFTSSANRVKEMIEKMEGLDGQRVDNENHMRANSGNNKEIPARVPKWLEEVEDIKKKVEKIPSNDIGCFNVKKKYLAGRNALMHIKDIDRLIEENKGIIWRDNQIPLGRVNSKSLASTSTHGDRDNQKPLVNTQNVFASRVKTFNDALMLLQENDDGKTRVIALCGMGGVGKTTLMNQLKKAAEDNKMFKWIVVVVIGKSSNLFEIQNVIAAHTGESLTETNETLRATLLSKRFQAFSERKEKSLVILDDVWEKIKLEDIGLASPLPKGVKLLLTSRDENICQQIAVNADCALKVVRVDVLEEGEARDFFSRITGVSEEHDRDLYQIGCRIVKKCGCLPLAIKLIAGTLISQEKFVWSSTLKHLKKNDLDKNVQEIIEISYKNLKEEDKAIFLLCGLFPEDSNILIEDLTRYAWGLKLLKQVSTMEDARESTQTSVSNLKNAYLLMDGDSRDAECVKMHDLVLAFVVGTVSKGGKDGCWIIHHEDDFSKLSEANNMSQSCKQISLACKGMSEFPSEFKFPNLTVLKLMQGDESLKFPQDFYVGMEKLEVIAFEKLVYPLVPTSFQCSTTLRTLCLDKCLLMFDLTCIGNLSNLEVLSFANSGVTILPSTFGNLKKLKVLDVTGCYNLVIDDGVLKSLVKLEELYMRSLEGRALCFTDNNCSELAERSENLCALEFEFIGNNVQMKNMSFEKLKRFKLSVGCYFTKVIGELGRNKVDAHSYQNSLKLITNKEELLKSKISELFMSTDALYLQVNDMNTLEDVEIPHTPRYSSFYNLRLLVVSQCTELKYLFTPSVAKFLSKLEYLDISGCRIMEGVIHTENDGSDTIKFSNLKYLRLAKLPKLLHLCNNVDVIELPHLMELKLEGLPKITSIYPDSATSFVSSNISPAQSFLNAQDATPKLEKLIVSSMENLKEIWPPQFSISNMCLLRKLTVEGCGSIEVLFNMDFGEIEQLSSSLRNIKVKRCNSLVKLFSCNPFPFLNNLQELSVKSCGSIQVLFNTDLGRAGKSEEQVCSSSLRSIVVEECDSLVNLLPSNPMPLFNNLEGLQVISCASIEVIFDIDMGCVGEMDKVSSSRLRSIWLEGLGRLREVWRIKDAGNNLIHGFEAVERIYIRDCERFEKLITHATANIDMRALKEVKINRCSRERERSYELVERNQDQEIKVISSSMEQVNDDISKVALPFNLLHTFHHIHKLVLYDYKAVEVVFEITTPSSRESPHNTQLPPILPYLEELELEYMGRMSHVWKCDWNEFLILQKPQSQSSFHNLTTITMYKCNSIKYLFSPLMAKLLSNLKKVRIESCDGIEEVVSNRDDEDASIYSHINTGLFPHLDILELKKLRNFKCIGGGANGISGDIHGQLKLSSWSLCQYAREMRVKDCDALSSVIPWYAVGQMQKLQVLEIISCKSMIEVFETQEMNKKSGTDTGKSLPRLEYITMITKLKILKIVGCNLLKHLFTFSTLESLAKLEELEVKDCTAMEVIVTEENGQQATASDVVVFPHLKSLILVDLPNFVGFFLGKCDWNEFLILQKPESQSSFHNLTTITMFRCNSIKYLFSTLMAKLLSNLKKVRIESCDGIEEVVSNRDDEDASIYSHTTTSFFPHLDILELKKLRNFTCIGGGANGISTDSHDRLKLSSWSLCQYAREIRVIECDALSSVIPWYAVGQMQKLQVLKIINCKSMTEVFETQEIKNKSGADTGKSLPRLEYITMLKLPKLKILKIQECNLLKHIFTFSALESLAQLEELEVKDCKAMEVIVTEENGEQATASVVVVFPHLKSLSLVNLPNFVGFFLGKNEFTWPALLEMVVIRCPQITVFTYGRSTAPKLNFIYTGLGKHRFECGLNFHAQLPSYESASSYRPTTMERLPWSYYNLIEVNMVSHTSGGQTLFSSDKLLQLQKLETVRCTYCRDIEQIFDSQTVAEIPNLRQVELVWLDSLKYIWKSKQGTVLKFPNLTRLSIDRCDSLEYVFTCSMVGSILQLQELHISHCHNMKVIVKGEEEECDAIVNATVELPCLKSLRLEFLFGLEGFCLGKEAFEFPSFDTLQITCAKMTVFTKGDLSAPKLHAIRIGNRKYNIHNRLNSVIKTFNEYKGTEISMDKKNKSSYSYGSQLHF